jgi:hypothetical protein
MELHTAIRGILKMQGQDFATNPGFINALEDFNAFEQNEAYKNVLRIISQDGYIPKLISIGAWNIKAQQLVTELVSRYSFDSSICGYILESLAYGLGFCNVINLPSASGQGQQSSTNTKNNSITRSALAKSKKQLERMSEEERNQYIYDAQDYLDGIIEIDGDWRKDLGAQFTITSSVTLLSDGDGWIEFRIEIKGRIDFKDYNYIDFIGIVYNEKGRVIGRVHATKFDSNKKRIEVLETRSLDSKEYKDISNIERVVFYWDGH